MLSISRGAETRTVSAPTTARSSKLAAATVITTVPDLTPVMRPCASTVATLGLLLDQRNTTLGIGCESAGPRICHACGGNGVGAAEQDANRRDAHMDRRIVLGGIHAHRDGCRTEQRRQDGAATDPH